MNRLMLCAGIVRRQGWQTLDANAGGSPDFLATIPPLPNAVKSIVWDEVEWIHGVGTFYPWDAAKLLSEIHAVMVPGGVLILEQPDFRQASQRVEWLFGDPTFQNPLLMNRWAYTPESLSDALRTSGFGSIRILPAQFHIPARDFRIEAFA